MIIILIGPPASGKSTIGKQIAELGLPFLASGDLVRAAQIQASVVAEQQKSPSQNTLVDDQTMLRLVLRELSDPKYANGVILDGFPRTVQQAREFAYAGFAIDHVLHLNIPDQICISRAAGRRAAAEAAGKPARTDDNADYVLARLSDYHQLTKPLIAYFAERQKAGLLTITTVAAADSQTNAALFMQQLAASRVTAASTINANHARPRL